MTIDVTRSASITVVCGGSGSGKSAWVKQQVRDAHRLIVWDVDDEYGTEGCQRITAAGELVQVLMKAGRGAARIAFCPPVMSQAAFSIWARAAFAWGECVAVAEELAGVTTPAKAPPGWHELVSRGRKRGVVLYAVTQRPSESDKTVMGNATRLHVGRLQRAQDRAYMARELDVEQVRIDRLKKLEWIERDNGELKEGRVTFT